MEWATCGFVLLIGAYALCPPTWGKTTLLLMAIGAMGYSVLSFWGEPQVAWTTRGAYRGGQLVAIAPDEPHSYYAWVLPKGSRTPLAVKCPWDEAAVIQAFNALAHSDEGPPTMWSCAYSPPGSSSSLSQSFTVGPQQGGGTDRSHVSQEADAKTSG